jgi:hypothetical protein
MKILWRKTGMTGERRPKATDGDLLIYPIKSNLKPGGSIERIPRFLFSYFSPSFLS